MRYLITGGAGFIGSHLADALLARGEDVTALDDLSTGSLENVRHLAGNSRFRLVIGSIMEPETVAGLMPQCDVVFHLAAAVGVKNIIDNPLASIRTNIRGTEIVLEQADQLKRKTILASSSEVYGKNGHGPLSEDTNRVVGSTTITRWLYATTKACDEFLALAYHRERNLPTVIIRFFNTVGPRQTGRYGMVVPRFVRQALLGQPLTIHGDGQQTRCFTDVLDVVRCVIALADAPEAEGRVFNVGCEREITIESLARRVVSMTRSNSPIVHIPYEQAYERGFEDMRRRVPDVSRLRETVGFVPNTALDTTLQRIVDYMLDGRPDYHPIPAYPTFHSDSALKHSVGAQERVLPGQRLIPA